MLLAKVFGDIAGSLVESPHACPIQADFTVSFSTHPLCFAHGSLRNSLALEQPP